jgi:SAM-dependent methyltransferase
MAFALDQVVPWGRSFTEYLGMFDLSDSDLEKRILGCGDGPASFNAVLSRRGGRAVSADPLYQFSVEEIRHRIAATFEVVLEQTRQNADEFVWTRIQSVAELGEVRLAAMEEFLSDYPAGRARGRYRAAALPSLPFADGEFDLALCSHLLFLYSEQFSTQFHLASVRELCRVAREVRIFPLLELGARPSRHLEPLMAQLKKSGYDLKVQSVPYEFQKGGNRMLRVRLAAWRGGPRTLCQGSVSTNY